MRTQLSKRYAVTVILSHARNVTNRVVSDYYVRKRDHPVTRLTDPNVICMHQRRPYVAGAHDVNNRDNTKAGSLAAPCMPRTKKPGCFRSPYRRPAAELAPSGPRGSHRSVLLRPQNTCHAARIS
jgi:hypothetical protein